MGGATIRGGLSLAAGLGLAAFVNSAVAAQAGAAMANEYPAGTPPMPYFGLPTPRILTTDVLATDIAKSTKFYEDVFGMKVMMRRGGGAFESVFMAFPAPDGKTLTPPILRLMKDTGFVHTQTLPDLTIVVDDHKPYVARSNAAGYPVTRSSDTNAFLNDPSGNIIELTTTNRAGVNMAPALLKSSAGAAGGRSSERP
jgi:catechol 2,3-dioxygenase-like lactoylglutathione lyase family enzyme